MSISASSSAISEDIILSKIINFSTYFNLSFKLLPKR